MKNSIIARSALDKVPRQVAINRDQPLPSGESNSDRDDRRSFCHPDEAMRREKLGAYFYPADLDEKKREPHG
jgi:hypothetical protein